VAKSLEQCASDSWSWSDLGAESKDAFVKQCLQNWDDMSGDLTTYEAQQAIEVCETSRETIDPESSDLQCDEILGIYLQSHL